MRRWLRRAGIRLALAYVLVFTALMSVFAGGIATVFFLHMRAQLERYTVQDIETVEGLLYVEKDGTLRVREDYHNHPDSRHVLERFLEVRTPGGELLYRNDRLRGRSLGGVPLSLEGVGGYSERAARLADGTRVVMVSRRHTVDGRETLIRLAYSEDAIWHAMRDLAAAAALMLPVMIAVTALAGYRMSRRVLEPIQQIASQARQITSHRLHERLPVAGTGDELDHLSEVINQTLARLDQSFQQLRQFTSDASHELRTPLAAIRTIGEVGLQRDGTRDEYREMVGSMLEEANRLTQLIDELLMLSRADAGVIPLHRSRVSITALAGEAAGLLEPLAEEKRQIMTLSASGEAVVQADPVLIRQALINVLHNAIKYSPEGAPISIAVEACGTDGIAIEVRDCGPGIAPEHAERIFDRFYRVDQGRSRDAGGFGLGLAIAHWAVDVHGGTMGVSPGVDGGCVFRITLPGASVA